MRARRFLWFLSMPALLAMSAISATLAARPGPPPAAAQAEPVPAICAAPLPLPSALPFDKSGYERRLGRFLRAECYRHLGWARDKQVRPTGPTVAALGGPPATSVAYFDALTAPSKKLVWFEESGHEMFADEPARFNAAMVELVRPVVA